MSMDNLSSSEQRVFELVIKGLSNREIANKLFVTEKTIKYHLTNIYKELSLKSRSQLIAKHLNDVLTPEEISGFKSLL